MTVVFEIIGVCAVVWLFIKIVFPPPVDTGDTLDTCANSADMIDFGPYDWKEWEVFNEQ